MENRIYSMTMNDYLAAHRRLEVLYNELLLINWNSEDRARLQRTYDQSVEVLSRTPDKLPIYHVDQVKKGVESFALAIIEVVQRTTRSYLFDSHQTQRPLEFQLIPLLLHLFSETLLSQLNGRIRYGIIELQTLLRQKLTIEDKDNSIKSYLNNYQSIHSFPDIQTTDSFIPGTRDHTLLERKAAILRQPVDTDINLNVPSNLSNEPINSSSIENDPFFTLPLEQVIPRLKFKDLKGFEIKDEDNQKNGSLCPKDTYKMTPQFQFSISTSPSGIKKDSLLTQDTTLGLSTRVPLHPVISNVNDSLESVSSEKDLLRSQTTLTQINKRLKLNEFNQQDTHHMNTLPENERNRHQTIASSFPSTILSTSSSSLSIPLHHVPNQMRLKLSVTKKKPMKFFDHTLSKHQIKIISHFQIKFQQCPKRTRSMWLDQKHLDHYPLFDGEKFCNIAGKKKPKYLPLRLHKSNNDADDDTNGYNDSKKRVSVDRQQIFKPFLQKNRHQEKDSDNDSLNDTSRISHVSNKQYTKSEIPMSVMLSDRTTFLKKKTEEKKMPYDVEQVQLTNNKYQLLLNGKKFHNDSYLPIDTNILERSNSNKKEEQNNKYSSWLNPNTIPCDNIKLHHSVMNDNSQQQMLLHMNNDVLLSKEKENFKIIQHNSFIAPIQKSHITKFIGLKNKTKTNILAEHNITEVSKQIIHKSKEKILTTEQKNDCGGLNSPYMLNVLPSCHHANEVILHTMSTMYQGETICETSSSPEVDANPILKTLTPYSTLSLHNDKRVATDPFTKKNIIPTTTTVESETDTTRNAKHETEQPLDSNVISSSVRMSKKLPLKPPVLLTKDLSVLSKEVLSETLTKESVNTETDTTKNAKHETEQPLDSNVISSPVKMSKKLPLKPPVLLTKDLSILSKEVLSETLTKESVNTETDTTKNAKHETEQPLDSNVISSPVKMSKKLPLKPPVLLAKDSSILSKEVLSETLTKESVNTEIEKATNATNEIEQPLDSNVISSPVKMSKKLPLKLPVLLTKDLSILSKEVLSETLTKESVNTEIEKTTNAKHETEQPLDSNVISSPVKMSKKLPLKPPVLLAKDSSILSKEVLSETLTKDSLDTEIEKTTNAKHETEQPLDSNVISSPVKMSKKLPLKPPVLLTKDLSILSKEVLSETLTKESVNTETDTTKNAKHEIEQPLDSNVISSPVKMSKKLPLKLPVLLTKDLSILSKEVLSETLTKESVNTEIEKTTNAKHETEQPLDSNVISSPVKMSKKLPLKPPVLLAKDSSILSKEVLSETLTKESVNTEIEKTTNAKHETEQPLDSNVISSPVKMSKKLPLKPPVLLAKDSSILSKEVLSETLTKESVNTEIEKTTNAKHETEQPLDSNVISSPVKMSKKLPLKPPVLLTKDLSILSKVVLSETLTKESVNTETDTTKNAKHATEQPLDSNVISSPVKMSKKLPLKPPVLLAKDSSILSKEVLSETLTKESVNTEIEKATNATNEIEQPLDSNVISSPVKMSKKLPLKLPVLLTKDLSILSKEVLSETLTKESVNTEIEKTTNAKHETEQPLDSNVISSPVKMSKKLPLKPPVLLAKDSSILSKEVLSETLTKDSLDTEIEKTTNAKHETEQPLDSNVISSPVKMSKKLPLKPPVLLTKDLSILSKEVLSETLTKESVNTETDTTKNAKHETEQPLDSNVISSPVKMSKKLPLKPPVLLAKDSSILSKEVLSETLKKESLDTETEKATNAKHETEQPLDSNGISSPVKLSKKLPLKPPVLLTKDLSILSKEVLSETFKKESVNTEIEKATNATNEIEQPLDSNVISSPVKMSKKLPLKLPVLLTKDLSILSKEVLSETLTKESVNTETDTTKTAKHETEQPLDSNVISSPVKMSKKLPLKPPVLLAKDSSILSKEVLSETLKKESLDTETEKATNAKHETEQPLDSNGISSPVKLSKKLPLKPPVLLTKDLSILSKEVLSETLTKESVNTEIEKATNATNEIEQPLDSNVISSPVKMSKKLPLKLPVLLTKDLSILSKEVLSETLTKESVNTEIEKTTNAKHETEQPLDSNVISSPVKMSKKLPLKPPVLLAKDSSILSKEVLSETLTKDSLDTEIEKTTNAKHETEQPLDSNVISSPVKMSKKLPLKPPVLLTKDLSILSKEVLSETLTKESVNSETDTTKNAKHETEQPLDSNVISSPVKMSKKLPLKPPVLLAKDSSILSKEVLSETLKKESVNTEIEKATNATNEIEQPLDSNVISSPVKLSKKLPLKPPVLLTKDLSRLSKEVFSETLTKDSLDTETDKATNVTNEIEQPFDSNVISSPVKMSKKLPLKPPVLLTKDLAILSKEVLSKTVTKDSLDTEIDTTRNAKHETEQPLDFNGTSSSVKMSKKLPLKPPVLLTKDLSILSKEALSETLTKDSLDTETEKTTNATNELEQPFDSNVISSPVKMSKKLPLKPPVLLTKDLAILSKEVLSKTVTKDSLDTEIDTTRNAKHETEQLLDFNGTSSSVKMSKKLPLKPPVLLTKDLSILSKEALSETLTKDSLDTETEKTTNATNELEQPFDSNVIFSPVKMSKKLPLKPPVLLAKDSSILSKEVLSETLKKESVNTETEKTTNATNETEQPLDSNVISSPVKMSKKLPLKPPVLLAKDSSILSKEVFSETLTKDSLDTKSEKTTNATNEIKQPLDSNVISSPVKMSKKLPLKPPVLLTKDLSRLSKEVFSETLTKDSLDTKSEKTTNSKQETEQPLDSNVISSPVKLSKKLPLKPPVLLTKDLSRLSKEVFSETLTKDSLDTETEKTTNSKQETEQPLDSNVISSPVKLSKKLTLKPPVLLAKDSSILSKEVLSKTLIKDSLDTETEKTTNATNEIEQPFDSNVTSPALEILQKKFPLKRTISLSKNKSASANDQFLESI